MLSNDFTTGVVFGICLQSAAIFVGILITAIVASRNNANKQPRKG